MAAQKKIAFFCLL